MTNTKNSNQINQAKSKRDFDDFNQSVIRNSLNDRELLKKDAKKILRLLLSKKGEWIPLVAIYDLGLEFDEHKSLDFLIKNGYEIEKLQKFRPSSRSDRISIIPFYRLK